MLKNEFHIEKSGLLVVEGSIPREVNVAEILLTKGQEYNYIYFIQDKGDITVRFFDRDMSQPNSDEFGQSKMGVQKFSWDAKEGADIRITFTPQAVLLSWEDPDHTLIEKYIIPLHRIEHIRYSEIALL